LILDTSEPGITPDQFNCTRFPALIFLMDGKIKRVQYRDFDDEFMSAFINTNAVGMPEACRNKTQLEKFYRENALGLVVAIGRQEYENIELFHREHFNELSIAYAEPSLFEEPGFYLYKSLDNTVTKLPDLRGRDQREIAMILNENIQPEFSKLNSGTAGQLEQDAQVFAVLLLVMEDFYLTPEHLQLARNLKDRTGVNVTYADVENSQICIFRYGLPDSLDSTMGVIDVRGDRLMKYMLTDPLSLESAEKLVNSVLDKTAKPYWKSEIDLGKPGDGPVPVSANQLLEWVEQKKTFSIAMYYTGGNNGLEPYINATALSKSVFPDAIFGKMSMGANDWPLDEFEVTKLPFLVVFVDGEKVYCQPAADTTEEVVLQLTAAFEKKALPSDL
jgi:hypothetical protein